MVQAAAACIALELVTGRPYCSLEGGSWDNSLAWDVGRDTGLLVAILWFARCMGTGGSLYRSALMEHAVMLKGSYMSDLQAHAAIDLVAHIVISQSPYAIL